MIDVMGGIVTCRVSPGAGWFEKKKAATYAHSQSMKPCDKIVHKTKTVYLIRHAESNENRRLESLSRSLHRVAKMQIPYKDDVTASVELLNVQAQIDSFVSKKGEEQINQLAKKLIMDDFVRKKGIKLVAHSPLIRARQTSEGMLGCVTPRTASNVEELWQGKKAPTVDRVVELPCLAERTPLEWLPVNHEKFRKRVEEFENWLNNQPEEIIAIVGHSNYFRGMLDLPYKFGNCDVWELKFKPKIDSELNLGPMVDVNGDTVQTIQEPHSQEIEMIHGEVEEEYREDIEHELPRGWSNLMHLYSYEPTV